MTTDDLPLWQQPRYPSSPGHRGTDTSRAAAESVAGEAGTLRADIMRYMTFFKLSVTADECADALGLSCLSCRPRFSELLRMGRIEDTGLRRANASGRKAIVWRVRP